MRRPGLGRLPGRRRQRQLAAALALLTAVAVIIAIVVRNNSPSKPAAATVAATTSGSATVERRDLVATDTEAGTLSYAGAHTVYDQLSGTITWLPRVGQLIKPGQTLLDVAGRPVILMNGRTPAYRNLSASDGDGADIEQLNRNLVDLGLDPDGIVVDDAWQPATTVGVELLQKSLGETETGSLSLGQIVFLPGDQLISTVDATLGSTGGSSANTSPPSAGSASTPASSGAPAFVNLATSRTTNTTSTAPTVTSPTSPTATATTTTPTTTTPPSPASRHRPTGPTGSPTLAHLTALLRAEAAQLKAATAALRAAKTPASSTPQAAAPTKSTPSASSPSAPTSPSGGGSSSPVLQTTSTRLVVTVNLDASKQSEATVGERVSVEMPAGNTVTGKITAISRIAQTPSSSSTSTSTTGATIPVTITLTGHHQRAGLDQAAVSVNFAQARARNVLSVPVTALLATAGGGYALQQAAAPHTLIPVTTGLFAAGDVQISGPGIYPGLQVSDSQG